MMLLILAFFSIVTFSFKINLTLTLQSTSCVQMIPIGTSVRILYPSYAAGKRGRIEGREGSGRYIVRLQEDVLREDKFPLVLSLEVSDFELVHDQ